MAPCARYGHDETHEVVFVLYSCLLPWLTTKKAIYHVRYMPPLSRNLRDLPSTNGLVAHWPACYRAVPVAGCPRRWALPCHFPDCSHERVLLPESFRGVAPSVGPASPMLISAWQGGRSPLSCIEQKNASAVYSSAQAHDGMPCWRDNHNFFCASGSILSWGPCLRNARSIPI